MRIGASTGETRKLWSALPALAASAPLGGPRPGATVLAVTTAPGGAVYPVVAVQRYGHGRSMVFAGEASWRWKMLVPSTDRSYEFFWRQAARWLAATAPDPVTITRARQRPSPATRISIDVDARDRAFAPVPDASVEATLTAPGGDATAAQAAPRRTRPAAGSPPRCRPDAGRSVSRARRGQARSSDARQRRPLVVRRRRDREFADPAPERRLPAACRARVRRPVRPRRRGRAASRRWLQATAPQQPNAGAPRSLARAVGVRARSCCCCRRNGSCGGAGDSGDTQEKSACFRVFVRGRPLVCDRAACCVFAQSGVRRRALRAGHQRRFRRRPVRAEVPDAGAPPSSPPAREKFGYPDDRADRARRDRERRRTGRRRARTCSRCSPSCASG